MHYYIIVCDRQQASLGAFCCGVASAMVTREKHGRPPDMESKNPSTKATPSELSKELYNTLFKGFRKFIVDPRVLCDDTKVVIFPMWPMELGGISQQFNLYKLLRENLVVEKDQPARFTPEFTKRLHSDKTILTIRLLVEDNGPRLYDKTTGDGLCYLRRVYQHEKSNGELDRNGDHDPNLVDPLQRAEFVSWLNHLPERSISKKIQSTMKAPEMANWALEAFETHPHKHPKKRVPREAWGCSWDIFENLEEVFPSLTMWHDDGMGTSPNLFLASTGMNCANKLGAACKTFYETKIKDCRKRYRTFAGHISMIANDEKQCLEKKVIPNRELSFHDLDHVMAHDVEAHTLYSGEHYFQMQSPFMLISAFKSQIHLMRDFLIDYMASAIYKSIKSPQLSDLTILEGKVVQGLHGNNGREICEILNSDEEDELSVAISNASTAPTEVNSNNSVGSKNRKKTNKKPTKKDSSMRRHTNNAAVAPERSSSRLAEKLTESRNIEEIYFYFPDGSKSSQQETAGWSFVRTKRKMDPKTDPFKNIPDGQNISIEQFQFILNCEHILQEIFYGPVLTKKDLGSAKINNNFIADVYFEAPMKIEVLESIMDLSSSYLSLK